MKKPHTPSRNRSSSPSKKDRAAALAAVERIRQRRKGIMLRGLQIKDLITEGRR
jgi:hypothetical protein